MPTNCGSRGHRSPTMRERVCSHPKSYPPTANYLKDTPLESHPSGLEACAQNLMGMRPAWRARYPAVTAAAIAAAIVGGSAARVTAVASSTASQPSSIASAASVAMPMPASSTTGHTGPLDDQLDVVRVGDTQTSADRRPQRHHRRAAGVLEPAGKHRIVVGVGQHDDAV